MADVFHLDMNRVVPGRPPVLLLGGLNLVRALGLARIPAIVATSDAHEPALHSHYCSGWLRLPSVEERRDAAAEALLEAGAQLARACGHPVPLLYGNDDHLALILAHRARMTSTFLLRLNDPQVARSLLEKDLFELFARQRGLPVPRTLSWDELPLCEGPVIAKHRIKLGWETSAVHLRLLDSESKGRIFASGREVFAHPAARALRARLTFHEFVPGDDRRLWSFHGYADAESRVLAWFVGRKIRSFPYGTGFSSYLELARNDELAALGHEIVARAPLKGVFKIDLKQDERTGRYLVIEINARFNLWHHVAARNGINLPGIAYEHLLRGTRPKPSAYRTRWRWLSFRLDARAARELVARGELGWGRWLASLLGARKVYDLFSWTDPLPFLCAFARRGRAFARRRMRQWLATAS